MFVLDEADWPKWLGEEPATPDELYALLKPTPDEALKAWTVDKSVGATYLCLALRPWAAGVRPHFGSDCH